jgi:5-methylthioadenosine/S-adenosylhomocysteine deaminase
MTLFRGHGDDLPLMRWLQEAIWPVEAKLDADDVYWGTRLACLEMIRTGTTKFWDMYWEPAAVARAVEDSGMRAVVGPPMIDPGAVSEVGARDRTLVEQLDQLAGCGPRVTPAVSPHSIYTVGTDGLEKAAALAAGRGLPLQIHLSETRPEVEDCLAKYGVRPAVYLDSIGLLGDLTVLAHGVWLDRDELELIAARGATVVANPVANMKLAVGGVLPYPDARRAGVRLALGTDGAGSNNSLDLLADLKIFALTQRHAAGDAEAIPVGEAWAIATGRRSPLVGDPEPLAPGKPADFILLDPAAYELALGNLESNLVYTASGSVVKTTVVDGRVLMEDREVEGADEVVAKAGERAARLGLA